MKTDLSYLLKLTEGNVEMIQEMVGIFYEQVDEFTEGLQSALTEKNWDRLSKVAHKAKSSISVMGMMDTAEKCRNLELFAAEQKEIESYPELVRTIITDLGSAVEELKMQLAKM
jgi:HPt (histidine-containing phosphotransfer) domain-containing protein